MRSLLLLALLGLAGACASHRPHCDGLRPINQNEPAGSVESASPAADVSQADEP